MGGSEKILGKKFGGENFYVVLWGGLGGARYKQLCYDRSNKFIGGVECGGI